MLEPMNDYIVLKLVEDEKTGSGIILPESSDPMFAKGEIIKKGPGKLSEAGERFEPLSKTGWMREDGFPVRWEGAKILFAKYAAAKIEHEGETFYFIKEADILAKI